MSIRKTALLVFGLAFLGLAVALNFTIERTVFNYLEDAEYNQVILATKQSQNLFDNQAQYIHRLVRDWAWWDDTYEFVLDRNENFVERNLYTGTFSDVDLDLVVMFDNEGEVVFQTEYDPDEDELHDVSPETISQFQSYLPSLVFPEEVPSVYGIAPTDSSPLIIAIAQIFPSDMTGEPIGTLVFGQYFDQTRTLEFSKLLQLSIKVFPWHDGDSTEIFREVSVQLEESPFAVEVINDDVAGGYFLMEDIIGDPVYVFKLDYPRVLNASSILMRVYLHIIGVILPAFFFTISFLLIKGLVLNPLMDMRKNIDMIGEGRNFDTRLPISGRTELSMLSSNINLMLDALQELANEQFNLETRFQILVESMDDIVATYDKRDHNIHLYGKAAKTFGINENIPFSTLQEIGLSLSDIVLHAKNIANCMKGENVSYDWDITYKGQWLVLQIALSPMRNSNGKITGVVAVCRDFTKLKKMEDSLKEHVKELRILNQASQIFIMTTEREDLFSGICELLVQNMGISAAAIYELSEAGEELMPVAAEGESLTFFDRVPFSSDLSALFSYGMQNGALNELQQHSSCTLCKQFLPKKINRFDDCMVIPLTSRIDEKFFLLSIYSEIDAFFSGTKLDQIEAFGNLINIALQKEQYFQEILRHREQLETLSHKLVNLQEEERRNIALELHDEIGQLLTVLKIILELSPEDTMEEVSPKVDEAREIIDTLLNRVRELSWSLRPAILDDLGLMPALVWLFARLEKQTGLETSFYNLDLQEDRYPAVLEITMFRIIQESLTNVERHANTKQVAVRLWQQKGTLNVQIADKGKGFIFNKGIHLLSIRERVKLMEGQLQVDTEPGEGCRITVMLPIPDVEDSDGN